MVDFRGCSLPTFGILGRTHSDNIHRTTLLSLEGTNLHPVDNACPRANDLTSSVMENTSMCGLHSLSLKYPSFTVIRFDQKDRAHRIGQKHEVRVFRLVTDSPVEERIISRATDKLNMTGLVVEAGKFNRDSKAAERK